MQIFLTSDNNSTGSLYFSFKVRHFIEPWLEQLRIDRLDLLFAKELLVRKKERKNERKKGKKKIEEKIQEEIKKERKKIRKQKKKETNGATND